MTKATKATKKLPKKKENVFLKNIMAGIGGFVPVAATLGLASAAITKVDIMVIGEILETGDVLGGLPHAINPATYAPVLYEFPGVGLIVLTGTLFVGGMLIRTWIGNKITKLAHYLMEQVPFVGGAFKMIKKVIDQVTAQDAENTPEKKPVMIEYTRDDVFFPAFSLGLSTMFKSPSTGERLEVIYVPTSPNPTSGFVILMSPKLVHDTEFGTDAQMELVLSCGFSQKVVPSVLQQQAIQADISTGEIITTMGVIEVSPHDSAEEEYASQPTIIEQTQVNETFVEPIASGDYTQDNWADTTTDHVVVINEPSKASKQD